MRRFGHGHSLAVGILLTLALERHALLAALLVFAAGVVLGLSWARIRDAAPRLVEAAQRAWRSPRPTAKQKAW